MVPAASALPMTVVASSPSNISGNSVTSSKVSRGASASAFVVAVIAAVLVVIVFPAHLHLTGGDVDVHDELGHERDEPLASVPGVDRCDVVRAVPDRATDDAQRAAIFALDGAADDVLDEVLARSERRQVATRDPHLGQRQCGSGLAIVDAGQVRDVGVGDRPHRRDLVPAWRSVENDPDLADVVERAALRVMRPKIEVAANAMRPAE